MARVGVCTLVLLVWCKKKKMPARVRGFLWLLLPLVVWTARSACIP